MAKKKKKSNKWKNIPNKDYDKKVAEKIKKNRERVYTKAFSTKQTFGPASDVIILDPAAFPEYNQK